MGWSDCGAKGKEDKQLEETKCSAMQLFSTLRAPQGERALEINPGLILRGRKGTVETYMKPLNRNSCSLFCVVTR